MRFEWDESKRKSNLRTHGLDFKEVAAVFESETTTVEDDRYDYDEIRYVSFGLLHDLVVAVVYTESDTHLRIISFRKATKNEENDYYKRIRD